jgi:ankyrin repeat protein
MLYYKMVKDNFERKNRSVKRKNLSVKRKNRSVKRKNLSVKRINRSVKRKNLSVKRKNRSVKCKNQSVKRKNQSVKRKNRSVKCKNKQFYKKYYGGAGEGAVVVEEGVATIPVGARGPEDMSRAELEAMVTIFQRMNSGSGSVLQAIPVDAQAEQVANSTTLYLGEQPSAPPAGLVTGSDKGAQPSAPPAHLVTGSDKGVQPSAPPADLVPAAAPDEPAAPAAGAAAKDWSGDCTIYWNDKTNCIKRGCKYHWKPGDGVAKDSKGDLVYDSWDKLWYDVAKGNGTHIRDGECLPPQWVGSTVPGYGTTSASDDTVTQTAEERWGTPTPISPEEQEQLDAEKASRKQLSKKINTDFEIAKALNFDNGLKNEGLIIKMFNQEDISDLLLNEDYKDLQPDPLSENILDYPDIYGLTPLMWAVLLNRLDYVKLLISKGANINYMSSGPSKLLLDADKQGKKSKEEMQKADQALTVLSRSELFKLFEINGLTVLIDIDIKDIYGLRALQIAIDKRFAEVNEYLISKGAYRDDISTLKQQQVQDEEIDQKEEIHLNLLKAEMAARISDFVSTMENPIFIMDNGHYGVMRENNPTDRTRRILFADLPRVGRNSSVRPIPWEDLDYNLRTGNLEGIELPGMTDRYKQLPKMYIIPLSNIPKDFVDALMAVKMVQDKEWAKAESLRQAQLAAWVSGVTDEGRSDEDSSDEDSSDEGSSDEDSLGSLKGRSDDGWGGTPRNQWRTRGSPDL